MLAGKGLVTSRRAAARWSARATSGAGSIPTCSSGSSASAERRRSSAACSRCARSSSRKRRPSSPRGRPRGCSPRSRRRSRRWPIRPALDRIDRGRRRLPSGDPDRHRQRVHRRLRTGDRHIADHDLPRPAPRRAGRGSISFPRHRAIFEAIKRGDADGARAAFHVLLTRAETDAMDGIRLGVGNDGKTSASRAIATIPPTTSNRSCGSSACRNISAPSRRSATSTSPSAATRSSA